MSGDKKRVELVLDKLGIEYKKRGNRLWAKCPYHEDHDPSWMIRVSGPRVGQHHCFTCKEGGGLADLVMLKRGYGTREAANEWLANFKEAPPPAFAGIRLSVGPIMSKVFRLPTGVIFESLEQWATPARKYAKRRHLTKEQIERWRIGYAYEGRLAGRIVIPVWSPGWIPRSYMARSFADADRKYLFPFEKEKPQLDYMFGELYWPSLRKLARVYVTEGAINALAIERVIGTRGYSFVAALGSSDVRPAHLAQLASFGEVIIATDPDKAGDIAAQEIDSGLARHTRVARVRFREGTDADSLSRDELKRCLALHPSPNLVT